MPVAAAAAALALALAVPGVLGSVLLAARPTEPWEPPAGAARDALVARYVHEDGEPGFFRCAAGAYLVKTDVDRAFALDVACYLERFRSQLRAIFREYVPERRPPLVVVYRDRERYRRVVGGGESRGFYSPKTRTLSTYLDVEKGERDFATFYARILLHEGTHQLVTALIGPAPPWFDEGVASYFQEWDVRRTVDDNLDRLKDTHYRFQDVRDAFGTERWVPLARLLALDRAAFAPDDFGPATNLHYAEAASFVSFLLATDERRKMFRRIYVSLRRQEGKEGLDRVLHPAAVGRLDEAWREHVAARVAAAAARD